MDVRGQGGLVIAEGAQHESGAIYTGNDLEVADLPDDIARVLLAHQNRNKTPASPPTGGASAWEEFASTGDPNTTKIGFQKRHKALVAYAGRLRNAGLDYDEALPVFHQRWLLCEQPTGLIPEAKYHGTPPPGCNYPVEWEEAEA
jgi:hypothetical protein